MLNTRLLVVAFWNEASLLDGGLEFAGQVPLQDAALRSTFA